MAYDKDLLESKSFEIPVIAVGNLSVGGTGKTPMIEYLIRLLIGDYRLAVLSRGYKRSSKGFLIADQNADAAILGDEPFQYHKKFHGITVAVDTDRVHGIQELLKLDPPPEIVLLDDALQHRKIQPGFTILLTSYDKLYVEDLVLPAGDLRENVSGAKRAQVIVVTKCPANLNEQDQFNIAQKLQPELDQTVFFTSIEYDEKVRSKSEEINFLELKDYDMLLVTGIAKTDPLTQYLDLNQIKYQHLKFGDHHAFNEKDFKFIRQNFDNLKSEKKIVLTTEKDFVRMFDLVTSDVFYLPIQTQFIANGKDFDQLIYNYVRKNSEDSSVS